MLIVIYADKLIKRLFILPKWEEGSIKRNFIVDLKIFV